MRMTHPVSGVDDVMIRLNGVGGWVPEKSVVPSREMIAGAGYQRTTRKLRRAPDHPYLVRQLSEVEIWTVHREVNPGGLFVRWRGSVTKNAMVMLA